MDDRDKEQSLAELVQIKKIPTEFKSVEDYMQIQLSMLMEEVRASVHLGILQIQNTQFYSASAVSDAGSSSLMYIDIDLASLAEHGVNHVVKDGDVFLLSREAPKDLTVDNLCFLGIARDIGKDNFFQKSFKLLVTKNQAKSDKLEIQFVSLLTNITEALNLSKAISVGSFPTIESILEKHIFFCEKCTGQSKVEELIRSGKYNEEQIEFIISILSKLWCPHENSVELVWGPPGTGKTRVASALVSNVIDMGSRVLVCVPRINDIIHFLKELQTLFPSFNFNRLLVLNTIDDIFAEVSIENRSHELYCSICLWKCWMKELIELLRLDMYIPKQEPVGHPGCSKQKVVQFSFPLFREKIRRLLPDVRLCSQALINRLSGISLTDNDVENSKKMLSALSEFDDNLQNNDISTFDLRRAFGIPATNASHSVGVDNKIAESLNETRIYCIKMIQDLLTSVELPPWQDQNDLEKLCIKYSQIIVCTPDCAFLLHEVKDNPLDILIVDNAANIRESDLLIPLLIPPKKHVVLLGDHQHVQPMVKSKVCKEAGYDRSLFERLKHLCSDNKMLRKQYVMLPMISKFPGKFFYQNQLLDSSHVKLDGYSEKLKGLKQPPYAFFDISCVDELKDKGKYVVESSVIMVLLEDMCNGLLNGSERVNIGVICLSRSQVNAIADQLGMKYESHSKIHLEVNHIDDLYDWYDVIILSSVCDDLSECLEGNKLKVAHTRTKHCLWIVGEIKKFYSGPTMCQTLHIYMKEQKLIRRMDREAVSKAMQQLDGPVAAKQTFENKSARKVGDEFTWVGRPYRTKYILASLRDQRGATDTCAFQASLGAVESLFKYQHASMDPPQDFCWKLSVDDLKSRYEKKISKEFGDEENKRRGKQRLQTALEILKEQGVKGCNEVESEDRIFRISSYGRLDTSDITNTNDLLRNGSIMVCHFLLSRNYFYLRPGESYLFDKDNPYIHPKSGLPVSHAVMTIGNGKLPMPSSNGISKCRRHVVIQNSEGKRFGIDGIGKVTRRSLSGLYQINI